MWRWWGGRGDTGFVMAPGDVPQVHDRRAVMDNCVSLMGGTKKVRRSRSMPLS